MVYFLKVFSLMYRYFFYHSTFASFWAMAFLCWVLVQLIFMRYVSSTPNPQPGQLGHPFFQCPAQNLSDIGGHTSNSALAGRAFNFSDAWKHPHLTKYAFNKGGYHWESTHMQFFYRLTSNNVWRRSLANVDVSWRSRCCSSRSFCHASSIRVRIPGILVRPLLMIRSSSSCDNWRV